MKKQLLTTTAMVAAGVLAVSGPALAKKPTLSVGGSTEQLFGVGENSDAFEAAAGTRVAWDQMSDTEIHFNGSVTLDNGIKIKTRVELEGNTNGGDGGGDTIDENWMRISGSFGEIRMGSHDGAGQAMTNGYMGTYATSVGQTTAFEVGDWIAKPTAVSAGTINRVDLSSDGEAVSYYTPRMSGFQLGATYHPSSQEDLGTRSLKSAGDHEGFSFGTNYVTKMDNAKIAIAAGYATTNGDDGNSDPDVWGVATKISFNGFTVAASWMEKDDRTNNVTGVTAVAGNEALELGANYIFGANGVSINYLESDSTTNSTVSKGDNTDVLAFAYRRILGPGVSFSLTAFFADFNDGATGALAGTSNDGQALVSGLKVKF
jgi:outer membrane protein OmpU